MKILQKLAASVLSMCIAVSASAAAVKNIDSVYAVTGGCTAEYLDRGITAVNTGSGMLVSWRYLASDDDNAVFNLYRDNTLIYTSGAGEATCYLDAGGSAASKYRVDTLSGGSVVSSSDCSFTSGTSYFDIPLNRPAGGSGYEYSPNDCSVGDVNGDGVYELFVKWDPSNSQDNSKTGITGNVYIDCYMLNGTMLWRIDLGVNIRAGAHYTQFIVADFDLDGKAEMTCKTADGTIDGTGKAIGDRSKVYRDSSGLILTGPEYYTLFDGATGAALDTVNYEYPRGAATGNEAKNTWGDNYGNRCERYLGAAVYCDGVKPSAVSVRGYYTRMTVVAYDVVNKKLVKRWGYDTGFNSSAAGYGDGNHNCMPADVDGDGKQELILGATCLDDNGKVLWCNKKGHGDAMHLSDFLPDRPGQELWVCHEHAPYGVSLIDAATGKDIFHFDAEKDTGRCAAGNVWAGNPGAEFWGARPAKTVLNGSGQSIPMSVPAMNFLTYWDGDLERELLDGGDNSPASITKIEADGKPSTLLTTTGFVTNNSTKANPCLSADIFGDWREELIVRAADNRSVRVYCTTYDTDYRVTTLMHDIQYRTQVAGQNTAYNQPPHASFYLGTEKGVPAREKVKVLPKGTVITPPAAVVPASFVNGSAYKIKNVNSGLYMQTEGNTAANSVNVLQSGSSSSSANDVWKLMDAGGGYYYVATALGDGCSFVLDIDGKKTANGTNVSLYTYNGGTNQQFMFTKNSDGSYKIRTRLTSEKSAVEVKDGSDKNGANIQQWEVNGADCQDWVLEPVKNPGCVMDTSVAYTFKNVNSGMVMEIKNGSMAENSNVQQWESNGFDCQKWLLQPCRDGGNRYYIRSASDIDYALKVNGSANGANIAIAKYSETDDNMLFKFNKNMDGSYYILTNASDELRFVEVDGASKSAGANVQQWESTNNDCQKWTALTSETNIVITTQPVTQPTTAATTTTVVTTTTTVPSAVKGDVNGDGAVNSADIVMLQHYLVKKISDIPADAADIDGNGIINVYDLLRLKRVVAG